MRIVAALDMLPPRPMIPCHSFHMCDAGLASLLRRRYECGARCPAVCTVLRLFLGDV